MSSFGRVYRVTTFGESHGKCNILIIAVGVIIDGFPSNFILDFVFILNKNAV